MNEIEDEARGYRAGFQEGRLVGFIIGVAVAMFALLLGSL